MQNKVKIKICGIKSKEIALRAVEYGADMLGLVFAKSRRQVDLPTAYAIRDAVPKAYLVGVFKDQPLEEILRISKACGLDAVQLHGNEAPVYLEKITLPVFRSVSVGQNGLSDFSFERWQGVEAFLLDTALADGSSGGAGTSFDWRNIHRDKIPGKIIVAGGLNQGNVTKAIKLLRPDAVDVSGGVERKGEKSPELIKLFINEIRKFVED